MHKTFVFHPVYLCDHEIDPVVPELDIVKGKGQWFKSPTFQACFGCNFLWDTLAFWDVVPLILAVNSDLFSCKTHTYYLCFDE